MWPRLYSFIIQGSATVPTLDMQETAKTGFVVIPQVFVGIAADSTWLFVRDGFNNALLTQARISGVIKSWCNNISFHTIPKGRGT